MGLWDQIYNSRVWVFAVATLWYAICLAVLEAHNEASHVAVFTLASVSLLLGHWYSAYLGYRLWHRLSDAAPLVGRLPLVSKPLVPSKSPRDTTSLWAWFDCWLMLVLVWALWSHACYTNFPDAFDVVALHLPADDWAASFAWINSIVSLSIGIQAAYLPKSAAVAAAHAAAAVLFKLYDMLVFSIAFMSVYSTIKDREADRAALANSKKRDLSGNQDPPAFGVTHSSCIVSEPLSYSYHAASTPLLPTAAHSHWNVAAPVHQQDQPQAVYWNQNAPDEIGLVSYLNAQYSQQHASGSNPVRMM